MKKTYFNPTCEVTTMKTESFMANTIIGGVDGIYGSGGIDWGGLDDLGGVGADVNRHDLLWAEEEDEE